MTPASELVTLTPSMGLEAAACALCEHKISGAPVVNNGVLVGVISQKDLLYSAAGRTRVRLQTSGPRSERMMINSERMRKILEGDVGSVMSARPATVAADTTVREAAQLLLDRGISRVPVTDPNGALIGLLSTTDVMTTVTSHELGCHVFDA